MYLKQPLGNHIARVLAKVEYLEQCVFLLEINKIIGVDAIYTDLILSRL